uniref:Gustatory receptor n=1 Tax=Glossina brevipalpis TaxID=37001 RepID=A0A1A9X4W4_9MUSC
MSPMLFNLSVKLGICAIISFAFFAPAIPFNRLTESVYQRKQLIVKVSYYRNFEMNSITTFNGQVPIKFNKEFEHFQRPKRALLQVSTKLNANNTNKYQTLNNHLKWNVIKRQFFKTHHRDEHDQRIHQRDIEKVIENKTVERALLSRDKMLETIDSAMMIEYWLIKLVQDIIKYHQYQLLCIFFLSTLTIVFNAYNLVVFLLKTVYTPNQVQFSPIKLLFFYGYNIMCGFVDACICVVAYSGTFKTIKTTAGIVDELNLYVSDETIKLRLNQFSSLIHNSCAYSIFAVLTLDGSLIFRIISTTTTYIIILLQYSGEGDICKGTKDYNKTNTFICNENKKYLISVNAIPVKTCIL